MSTGSAIQWTEATWNPVSGCRAYSPGCANCYAAKDSWRFGHIQKPALKRKYHGVTVKGKNGKPHFTGEVRCHDEELTIPLKVRKPMMWFVNSMSDLFFGDEADRKACEKAGVPFRPVPFEFIDKVFAVMALCPQHTFQMLTKRPDRMAEYLLDEDRAYQIANAVGNIIDTRPNADPGDVDVTPIEDGGGLAFADTKRKGDPIVRRCREWMDWFSGIEDGLHPDELEWGYRSDEVLPLPNVWLGTSCENQAAADERIPHLLRCPAAVRFLSLEPLIGAVDLGDSLDTETYGADGGDGPCPSIHWVIVGGESGGGSRPCDVAWIRSIIEQCKSAGVPCFVKQLGACIEMKFDEWNEHTGGGTSGSDKFTLLFDGCDRGYWRTRHEKGGDIDEWPEDLRVRGYPEVRA